MASHGLPGYEARFGRVPSSDAVACVAAGISLSFGLQSYGGPLEGLNVSERRQEIRFALGGAPGVG